jgi:hypothetical protein
MSLSRTNEVFAGIGGALFGYLLYREHVSKVTKTEGTRTLCDLEDLERMIKKCHIPNLATEQQVKRFIKSARSIERTATINISTRAVDDLIDLGNAIIDDLIDNNTEACIDVKISMHAYVDELRLLRRRVSLTNTDRLKTPRVFG